MQIKLLFFTAVTAVLIPFANYAQAPVLGTAANFVLFSSNGAVTNSGISHYTGNVGTNNGSSTGFGNVDGVMHDNDLVSAQASTDLLIAYNQLNATIPQYFPSSLLGNGVVFTAGVYSISGAAILGGALTFDAQNNPNAVFIIQIEGAFSTNANSEILLANGALACNIFWKVEGLVSMASGTTMRGTIIANNAAINMNTNNTLEGRAFSTTGAVTADGVLSYMPLGCGSPELNGPTAPVLASTACYTLFSGNGSVTNAGITYVTGDVGSNVGPTTGFDAVNVIGTIHPQPDTSTAQAAADLATVYTYLNTIPYDIELLYPAQFGNDLVLTPHTYLLNAATVLTNTLYLNAQGNSDAVFVLQVNGAFSTSTYANVILTNGTQAKNVFWKIDGATSISDYSVFKGTLIGNNGAVSLSTGVTIDGRAFSTTGSVLTNAVTATMTAGCANLSIPTVLQTKIVTLYPNPFNSSLNIAVNENTLANDAMFQLYDVTGREVIATKIIGQLVTVSTGNLQSGMYFYKIVSGNRIIQSGKLIAKP
ncbi:MAG: ice-binding family protein [Flavobacterium sp.]|nr:ice-binding family protein [Flavobacterium sp.]